MISALLLSLMTAHAAPATAASGAAVQKGDLEKEEGGACFQWERQHDYVVGDLFPATLHPGRGV